MLNEQSCLKEIFIFLGIPSGGIADVPVINSLTFEISILDLNRTLIQNYI